MKELTKEAQRKMAVTSLLMLLLLALIPFMPASAFAWGGSAHGWATEQAAHLFLPQNQQNIAPPNDPAEGSPAIQRVTKTPLFPELGATSPAWFEGGAPGSGLINYPNWEILKWNAIQGDSEEYDLIDWSQFCWSFSDPCWSYPSSENWLTNTYSHFWHPEFFGAMGETLGATKSCGERYPNAWVGAKTLWNAALWYWRHAEDDPALKSSYLGWAYTYLGHAVHLVEDMGEPAHVHEDLHRDTELFENWLQGDQCEANLSWFNVGAIGPKPADPSVSGTELNPAPGAGVIPKVPEPGDILYPSDDQAGIIGVANNVHYGNPSDPPCYLDNDDTLANDPDLFPDFNAESWPNNLPQLFYLMYVTNQIGDYCPSSGGDGDSYEPTGWLDYSNSQTFPTVGADGKDFQSSDRLGDEDNKEANFNQLAQVCYKPAFQVAHSVINLFRRTIDNVPPDTTVEMPDPNGSNGWYKSPFRVKLTGATDYGKPGYRPSGVWKVWGEYDGNPPTGENPPAWDIQEDGYHTIKCLSTDMAGNVDPKDVTFKYDGTPPEITFPGLRPNYLTSESFTVTWNATDAVSGVASEAGYFDGQLVTKGQVFNLAQMAGLHTLRVNACDNAGNCIDVNYSFEVWINAKGWCFSVLVNDKTQGNALSCVVEFPAPYNVALVDLNTSTDAVKGTIDLTKSNPVVGQTALLPGQLLTGVGDNDDNHIRDRKIQFRKDSFVGALGGQVGNIPSVIRGGLLPNGQPRFIAAVTVPVFKSPKK